VLVGVRERAAMGLCQENVPPPFQTRYLAPVSRRTAVALVRHLPDNYANDPHSPLAECRSMNCSPGCGVCRGPKVH
jgi:hypothetical protein